MPGRSGTAALLGRELEQAELYDALSLALKGEHQVVVVAGDAGVGKTTLVADLSRRAEELGFSVVVGHCLDIDAGISFAPVIEAVSALVVSSAETESRPLARKMRILLDPATPRSVEPVNLLDDLRLAVLEASGAGPVLLVLEDLHWADASTRDLVVALSRTARGRLMLVLTVRSEDLHRRHPARKTLAEIGRVPGGRRIELGPLGHDGIAGIVASITGITPDAARVRSVMERSEGNPLYAEEIAAAGEGDVPEQLSDLFLARIDVLDEGSRALARVASVDGSQVDVGTLKELAGMEPDRFSACLRDLLDANILRKARDSLEFRHGLLREAVYDDLLPDERMRLHAELATVLQTCVDGDPEPGMSLLSRLAFHWSAAHDLPRALAASVRAGELATQLGAPEGVTHLERALSMWGQVPDAEAVAGLHEIELILRLAESVGFQTDYERRYVLVRRALDMLRPDTSPLLASRVYSLLAFCALFHEDPIGSREASRRALEYAGESPSEELARALLAFAWQEQFEGHFRAGLDALERGVEMAENVGGRAIMRDDDALRPQALYHLGRVTEALEEIEKAVSRERRLGPSGDLFGSMEYLARLYADAGQVERGLALATAGLEEGVALGFPRQAGACGDAAMEALIWSGRFGDAQERLDVLRGLDLEHIWGGASTCELALARGDVEAAAPLVGAAALFAVESDTLPDDRWVLRRVRVAALLEDAPEALEAATTYLRQLETCDSPLIAGAAARVGYHALTLVAMKHGPASEELADLAARQRDRARAALTDEWRGGYYGVQLALAEGYAARVEGRSAVAEFRVAVGLAEPFGSFFALEPRLDLAQELLAQGDRDEGRELLVECWTAAHEMGAGGLERRAAKMATRHRVPLPESAAREGPLSRLTPREREILDRIATGATNQTIAEELFISPKTVSVHVSNVLAKLGVENRGAAAALARDLVG